MTGTRLVAVGHFQPERVVTNAELETIVETSDEWIQRRVGIAERRWAAPEESVDVMATKAAQDTLAKAGMTADQVDLVIVATCSALDRSPTCRPGSPTSWGSPARPPPSTSTPPAPASRTRSRWPSTPSPPAPRPPRW